MEDAIVEVKYWPSEDTYRRHFEDPIEFNNLVEQLRGYKIAKNKRDLRRFITYLAREE